MFLAEVRAIFLSLLISPSCIVTGVTSVEFTDFYGNGSQLVDGKWTLVLTVQIIIFSLELVSHKPLMILTSILARGNVYEFVNNMDNHPFRIQTHRMAPLELNITLELLIMMAYDGTTLRFEVPFSAPDTLYYQCISHTGMGGTIFIYSTLR